MQQGNQVLIYKFFLQREFEQLRDQVKRTKEAARQLLLAAKTATGTAHDAGLSEDIKKVSGLIDYALDSSLAVILFC